MRGRWAMLLVCAVLLPAQTPPEPATISGTVVNSITGEPILRAHVTVRCNADDQPQSQQSYGALSNEKGVFSIGPMPGGACWLQAERLGFIADAQNYALPGGAHKEDVKLKLIPTGAITGRVSNAAGEALQSVLVSADMSGSNNANTATTDDKGEFRIGGLRPGKYRVKAKAQNLPLPPEIRSDGSVELRDAATYYPDSVSAKLAQRIEVKAGAELSGIDIKLVQVPVTRVSGTVSGIPPGMKDVMVNLEPSGNGSSVKPDGTFTIWRLDPGKYTLRAQHWAQPQISSAPMEIEVTTADLDHLDLRLIAPFDVSGQLRFDDEQAREMPKMPKNSPPPPRKVNMRSLDSRNGEMHSVSIDSDDSFTLPRVRPGRYRLQVQGMSGYVKSIRAGQTETDGDVLDVRNGSPGPVTVTLSSQFCEVSGTVSDASGPVADVQVVLASTEQRWDSTMGKTDSKGAYKIQASPGKYLLAVIGDQQLTWGPDGPDLEGLEAQAVELSFGDKITRDLVRSDLVRAKQ